MQLTGVSQIVMQDENVPMQADDVTERNTIMASIWLDKSEKEALLRFVDISGDSSLADRYLLIDVHFLSRYLGHRAFTCAVKTYEFTHHSFALIPNIKPTRFVVLSRSSTTLSKGWLNITAISTTFLAKFVLLWLFLL
jgi:hypothetical protein